jgi:hypothetical protein
MRDPAALIRRALPSLTIAVLVALAYDGWIFYSRWRSAREGEEQRQAEEARRARQTIEMLGGTDFRIINFYASPRAIRRGEQAQLCFGVYGAKRVRIEPGIGEVHPAVSNCLPVGPRNDTEYKLTAEDGAGHTATASAAIQVGR